MFFLIKFYLDTFPNDWYYDYFVLTVKSYGLFYTANYDRWTHADSLLYFHFSVL
jgi:hypothetical protein